MVGIATNATGRGYDGSPPRSSWGTPSPVPCRTRRAGNCTS